MIHAFLQRGLITGLLVIAFTGTGALAQPARTKPTKVPSKATPALAPSKIPSEKPVAGRPAAAGPGGSVLTASFGDWGVYQAQAGKSRICYALSQPKERLPKALPKSVGRNPAYVFVSFRPAENVRNEVAFVMGYTAKETGPAAASLGSMSYALLTKGENAWLKNPAEEGQAIAAMAKTPNLLVKAPSPNGVTLTDRYSLTGFSQALERARKACS